MLRNISLSISRGTDGCDRRRDGSGKDDSRQSARAGLRPRRRDGNARRGRRPATQARGGGPPGAKFFLGGDSRVVRAAETFLFRDPFATTWPTRGRGAEDEARHLCDHDIAACDDLPAAHPRPGHGDSASGESLFRRAEAAGWRRAGGDQGPPVLVLDAPCRM